MKRLIQFSLWAGAWLVATSIPAQENPVPPTPSETNASVPSLSTNAPATEPPGVGAVSPAAEVAPAPLEAVPTESAGPVSTEPPETAAAGVSATAQSERNIRFQFEGMPYSEVLDRFAQMAGKPLVTDTKVEGTLTFNDPKPYNFRDAFDTLNLMLSMKDVMLVETDHYLRLVPFKQLPQMPMKILRGLDQTGDVRPGEVVTVVLQLENLQAGEVSQSIAPMLSSAGSVAALSRGKGLILTDRLDNIQRVRNLLATIDSESSVTKQMKTYTLLHASGSIVADLINKTFGASTAPRRTQHNAKTSKLDELPPNPEDYVTSIYDEASRTMVLWGPTERVALAEELITKFEKQGGQGGDIRIYYPQDQKPDALAQMIRQAIPGVGNVGELSPTKARLIPDAALNRLIVVAPIPGQLDAIDSFISQVDKGVQTGAASGSTVRSETIQITKVFRPRTAEPATISKILTEALSRRLPSGNVVPTASISVEQGSQSVVVSGSFNEVQKAMDIVRQLEQDSLPSQPLETKFFDVGTTAEAKRLQSLLEQLYKNQIGEASSKLPSAAKILADPDSGRLIVTASAEHLTLIEKLIQELQAQETTAQVRRLEIIPLKKTRMDQIQKSLTDLVSERMMDQRFQDLPKPLLIPDITNNRLLVTATEEQIKEVQAVLAALDIEPAIVPRETRIIALKHLRVDKDLSRITTLMNERLNDRRFESQPKPTMTPDAVNNRVLVTASAEQLKELEQVIQVLDIAPQMAERETRVMTLQHLSVDRGAASINSLLNERLTDPQFANLPKPTLTPDALNNRLIATATAEQFKEIEQVVALLDVAPETTKREMRVFPVKSKAASEMIPLVTQLLGQMTDLPTAPALAPKLIADATGKQIIVLAGSRELGKIEALIQQLDEASAPAAARQFKGIDLYRRNATEFTPLVQQLYQEQIKGQMQPEGGPATLMAETQNNRILVSGAAEEIARVETIIRQLDPESQKGLTEETRVVRLTAASASELVGLIEKSLNAQSQKVSVLLDQRSNSLVLTGEASAVEAAAKIIQQLDSQSKYAPRQMQIIELKSAEAATLTPMLQALLADLLKDQRGADYVPQTKITPDASSNRLILTGPEDELLQIAVLIEQLDQTPEQTQGAKVFKLSQADAATMATVVSNAMIKFDPYNRVIRGASVAVDLKSNSLIISGNREDLQNASVIIDQLDGEARLLARELRIVAVQTEDAEALAAVALKIFSEQTPGKMAQAQVSITPDPSGKRLIVMAPVTMIAQIERVIASLDVPVDPSARSLQAIEVKQANAQSLLGTVTKIYDEQKKGKFEKPATFYSDSSGNRLMVYGTKEQAVAIRQIVEALESEEEVKRELHSVEVTNADAKSLLSNVTKIYNEQKPKNEQKSATIYPDDSGRRFMVFGTKEQAEAIRQIVKILESDQPEPRQSQVFDLGKPEEIQRVQPLVQQLYRDYVTNHPQGGPADAQMIPDSRTGRLIVSARQSHLDQIGTIIAQLAVVQTNEPTRETRAFEVGNPADVERLLPLVEKLYKDQWKDKAGLDPADAQIMGDPRAGRIITTGKPDHLKHIESILQQLGVSTSGTRSKATPVKLKTAQRETRVIDLSAGNAVELATTVRTLYLDQVKSRLGTLQPDTMIMPDVNANRLIVVGEPTELDELENIVQMLDKTGAQSSSAKVFRLKSADPAKVAEILSSALVTYDSYGRPRKRVSISADVNTRTIIATGDPKELQAASVIIEQLDTSLGEKPERKLKVVTIKQGTSAGLAAKARQLYQDQVTARPDLSVSEILILEEAASNQLILAGSDEQLQILEDILKTLQSAQAERPTRETRLIEVGQPEQLNLLVPIVQQLYQEHWSDKAAYDPADARILADTLTGRLVVSGKPAHIAEVEAILAQLGADKNPGRQMRMVPVTVGSAAQLGPRVRQWYQTQTQVQPELNRPAAVITEDPVSNQLVLTGTSQQLELIEQITFQLMTNQVTQLPRETRMIDLGSASEVSRLLPLIQQLYQQEWISKAANDPADAQILSDAANGRFIVTGRANHIAAIESILQKLRADQNMDLRDTRVYDLTAASAMELSATVRALYLEQSRSRPGSTATETIIQPDTGANRIIVCGTTNELALVEDIITKLDKVSAQSASARVFRLKSADPTKVSEILQSALVTYDSYGRPRKRVSISVDANTRTIIATGDAKELQAASLIIEELDSSLSTQVERQMKVVSVQKITAAELSTKVQQLYQDQVKSRPELGIADALIMPDAASNQLILAGSAPQLTLIEEIITQLQEQAVKKEDRETRMLEIGRDQELTPIVSMVQQLYQQQWQDKGPSDLPDAQIIPDTKNGRLIVTARPAHLKAIEDILAKVYEPATSEGPRDVRLLNLTSASASEISTMVRALYDEYLKTRSGPPPPPTLIMPDTASNRLLVSGTTNEINVVADFVKTLDQPSEQNANNRVIRLKTANAEQVAEILNKAMVRYSQYGRPYPRVSVSADAATRTLILSGEREDLQAAAAIVEQLDSAEDQPARTMRVLPVKGGRVAELSTKIRQLYQDQSKAQPEAGASEALIMEDIASNQLILAGTEKQLTLIETIVAQIEKNTVTQLPRETRFFEIGQPDEVQRVLGLVQQLYTDQWKDKEAQDPADAQILPDTENGRLIVTARSAHLEEIEKILNQVKKSETGAIALETRVYDLMSTSAGELATAVQALYEKQLKSRPTAPVSKAIILPDVTANRLIVSATTNELAAIDSIVQELDKVDAKSGRTRVFKLKTADAEQVASVLSSSLIQMTPYGRQVARVSVGTDKVNNILIVSGEPKDLQAAAMIVEEMDGMMSREARQMRILALKNGLASEVSDRVKQLYEDQLKGQPQGGSPDALIMGDDVSNRLIITASETHMKLIESIVNQLQEAGEGTGRQMRILQLKNNSATSVAAMLQQLFQREIQSTDPGQRLVVSASSDDHTLVVEATGQTLEKVEALVNSLDTEAAKGAVEVRTYQIPEGNNAMSLAQTLQRLFMQRMGMTRGGMAPRFEGDPSANVLMVGATKDQFAEINKLIEELKQTTSVTNEVRTFVLQHGDPEQIARVLEEMLADGSQAPGSSSYYRSPYSYRYGMSSGSNLKQVKVAPAVSLNAVVVQGPPDKIALAEQLIQTLDSEEKINWEVRTYEAPEGTAMNLAQSLQRLFQERGGRGGETRRGREPRFEADSNANLIMVGATKDQFEQITKLIEEVMKSAAVTTEIRTFMLKNADSDQVKQVLEEMLADSAQSSMRSSYYPGSSSYYSSRYGRSGGSGGKEIRVSSAPSMKAVIVQGPSDKLALAEQLIKSLDSEEQMDWEVRTYQAPENSAMNLAQSLQRLFTERNGASRQGMEPRFEADSNSDTIMVGATKDQFEQITKLIEEVMKSAAVTTEIRTFMLKNADSDQVKQVLEEMLADSAQSSRRSSYYPGSGSYARYGRSGGSGGKEIRVSSAPSMKAVIVQGPSDKLALAEQLIKSLDSEEGQAAWEVRTYEAPEGSAMSLAQSLQRLFQERNGETKAGREPRFEADGSSNMIMVGASKDQFEQISKLIEEVMKSGAATMEIRTFLLKHGEPEQIARMLEEMLSGGSGSYRPSSYNRGYPSGASSSYYRSSRYSSSAVGEVKVAAAPSMKGVIVQGSPEKLAMAAQLILTLDQEDLEGQDVIQTVQLKKARAEEVAEAVNNTIASRTAQRGDTPTRLQRVNVTGVAGANSLLIHGPSDAVKEVLDIIQQLDQEGKDNEIEVRIYKLENGEAKEVSAIIEQLLQNVDRAQSRLGASRSTRPVPATVSVDESSNSLVISGTESHFSLVEKVLPTLDRVPERAERDIEIVWLQNADAMDVAFTLDSAFLSRPEAERPVIESDLMANTITIIAKPSDVMQAKEIIARLDEPSRDTSLQVRLRPISGIPVTQMVKMLTNIYPQIAPGQLRIVEKLPQPKAKVPVSPKPSAATNQASTATEAAAVPGLAETNAPVEVVIAIDREANALILSGPGFELDQVDRIISELTFSFIATDAEFRLFTLKEADPVIVAKTLGELFREQPVRVQPQKEGEQPKTVQPSPKIAVVPEPRTRSVIVRAKPTDFPLIESLIMQMDDAGESTRLNFRVVTLTNAQPEKVVGLVEEMVKQLNVVRPGEPLTVTVDTRSRGILIVARDNILDQVAKMVHSLDIASDYAEVEVLVMALKKASAPQLAGVLQTMLKPDAQGQLTPEARELQEQVRRLKVRNEAGDEVVLDLTQPIKIQADPQTAGVGGNRLILTSTPGNLKALQAVVEMMDSVPVLEGVEVKLIHIAFADASVVAQTLTSIFAQGRQLAAGPVANAQPEGESGKALVNPLNVAVDARSNTLVLSGQPESIELALKVIDDLDREIERFVTEVKLFRLKHASATRLLPLLQSVFAEGTSVPGTEGLSTMVTRLQVQIGSGKPIVTEQSKSRSALVVQADDVSNILIVAARSDALPLIEEVINQLDIPSASGMETVRIYPLNHADALAIQKVISDLHSGPRAAQLRREDIPNVTVDQRINALIITGTTKAFAIIEGLIQKLDQKLPFELRDIRIIPLENADASVVAGTIQQLMDARVTQRASLDAQQAELLKVIVLADSRSNSLLVGGSKDSFELVEQLAQQLDGASPALSGRIRLIVLKHADARALTLSLNQLFTQRYSAARTPDVQRQRPVIVADPRGNSLMVAAGMDDNQAIDELLQKLDQEITDPSMTFAVLALEHNDAVRVGAALEAAFTARQRSRMIPGTPPSPQDQVDIQTDALNNALIVFASKENLELIKGLLTKIDAEPMARGGLIQTFMLEHADAQRVADMLQSLVQQGLYRPGTPTGGGARAVTASRDALAVTVDPRSNTLIVSASPENMLVIKEIIKNVDTLDAADLSNVRFYQLEKARASSLARVLTQFFQAKRQGESTAVNAAVRSVPVAVIPDDRSNTLLVTAGKESFDVLERLIEQLDAEDVFARMNFRVFPLIQATASKMQSTLQQIFANRPPRVTGEPVEPITIVADSWVNALIVGASVEDLEMVSSLVERLDSEPTETGLSVQVLPLAKADARRIAETVQSLFREGTSGVAMPVTVSADERINAIVVSAGEADTKRISELVKKLDTVQVAKVSEIKVFPLKFAQAASMATILSQALNQKPTPLTEESPNTQSLLQFITRTEDGQELVTAALKEGVLITPDPRMNSLIVSGPVEYMGLLEQIITRLDNSSPQVAKIKVFQLTNADARQMVDVLMTLFRMQATGAASQRTVQYTLVRSEFSGQPMLGPEEELATATLGTDEQSALTVTVDPRTNSLLVGGTDHYVDLVSEVIIALDSNPGQDRRSEVYRLKNAQAVDVAAAVRLFLDQERQRVTQVLGPDAIASAQQMLEQEIAIVAEESSNVLLISANPRYFGQVTNLIDQLDQPQPQVLIQVLLAEVTLDGKFELGVEWTYAGSKGDNNFLTGTDFDVADELKAFGGYSAALTGSDYKFLLRALQNDGRLEILSRPQILTSDNQPATINIGQRVPLITDSRVTERGDSINSFTYENVGVNLTVTPRIGVDGIVNIDVATTNSAISSSSVKISSTAEVPIINQRLATTTVSVQSGQTIIIGGLIASVDDERVKKMPLLGDIPWLGALFRSNQKTTSRQELLILLTPQVLASRQAAEAFIPIDADVETRKQLDNSSFREPNEKNPYREQILTPLFPDRNKDQKSPPGTNSPGHGASQDLRPSSAPSSNDSI